MTTDILKMNVQICLWTYRNAFHSLHVHHAVAPYTCVGCHVRFWQFPGRSINHCGTLLPSIFFSFCWSYSCYCFVFSRFYCLILRCGVCNALSVYWLLTCCRRQKRAWSGQHLQCFGSVITNRYQPTQSVDDRPRSGTLRATTGIQDRFIRNNQALRNRSQTSNQIVANQATGVRVTGQTIRIRLHAQRLCLPWQIVTLPTGVNGAGSVRTGVFVAGRVSCFQTSP